MVIFASRATFFIKHLFYVPSYEKRGDRKIPQSLGLIEKLQFYYIFFFRQSQEGFQDKVVSWDKASQNDSSKRKSQTFLY